jgi:hypothetical protein
MWIAAGAVATGALLGRLLRPRVPSLKLEELRAVLRQTPLVRIADAAEAATVKVEARVVCRDGTALMIEDDSGRAQLGLDAGPSVLTHLVVPLAPGTRVAVVGTARWISGESGYRDLDRTLHLRPEPTIWLSTDARLLEGNS